MGEITRRWPFDSEEYGTFDLTIREPPLTGDSLGFKTWGSSYVLAQLLHVFAMGPLSHLVQAVAADSNQESSSPSGPAPVDVLELGSGTGLLGIAAACIWRTSVVLTDLPVIIPNLSHNAEINRATVEDRGGRIDAAALTWGGGEDEIGSRFAKGDRYKVRLHSSSAISLST